MAEKVSEVPNSKYQSLFLVLKEKETKQKQEAWGQNVDLVSSEHLGTPKKPGLEEHDDLRTFRGLSQHVCFTPSQRCASVFVHAWEEKKRNLPDSTGNTLTMFTAD